jgi:cell division protein FtsA
MNKLIPAIDIGEERLIITVAEVLNGEIEFKVTKEYKTKAFGSGGIRDFREAVRKMKQGIEEVERDVGGKIKQIYVGIGGKYLVGQPIQVKLEMKKPKIISYLEIEKLKTLAKEKLPPSYSLVQLVKGEFVIDGDLKMRDIIGIKGKEILGNFFAISTKEVILTNLFQIFTNVGIPLVNFVAQPVATMKIITTEEEKNLGCVVIDIRENVTQGTIVQDNQVKEIFSLPIGSNSVTNDIVSCLGVSWEVANQLKAKVRWDEFTRKDDELVQIVEARVEEIFNLLKYKLKKISFSSLSGGIILTSGYLTLSGIEQIARRVFDFVCKFRLPRVNGKLPPSIVGVIKYGEKVGFKKGIVRSKRKLSVNKLRCGLRKFFLE